MTNISKVGIIGAGQMGNGIAHVFAQAGFDVVLSDVSQESLDNGMATIEKNMQRLVGRGKMTDEDMVASLGRIVTSTGFDNFADVDLAIESAVENEEIKKKIFTDLCPILNETAILATNTSSISITRLAAITDRPDRFAGMHFMNPVPVMKLVELIRGITTSAETFDTIRELTVELNKTPVSSEDFPAFMVNRILLPMINEAIYTLYEGVGGVDAIDTAMRLGANHPMGHCNWRTSLVWIPALLSCRSCMTALQIPNTAPALYWSNMSKPAGSVARSIAVSTTIPAKSLFRRGKRISQNKQNPGSTIRGFFGELR